jgi:membrane protein implicated in regulation of membrane protease activity
MTTQREKKVVWVVVAWLVIGVVLLLVEMRHFAFYALFGSIGAFAAALVAWVAPSLIAAQVVVAVVVAVLGVLAVRPAMSRRFHAKTEHGPLGKGVHGALIGEEVLTTDVVGDVGHGGHVRLAGERWLAVSGSGTNIPAGTKVLVTAVQGTTLVVWPVELPVDPAIEAGKAEIEQSSEKEPGRAEGEQS